MTQLIYLFKFLDKWSTSLLNTYIEHCLIVWKNENNQENRSKIEKKIINILQSADIKMCDRSNDISVFTINQKMHNIHIIQNI